MPIEINGSFMSIKLLKETIASMLVVKSSFQSIPYKSLIVDIFSFKNHVVRKTYFRCEKNE
jgi:hypothetical protein